MIAVITAYKEGKTVQARRTTHGRELDNALNNSGRSSHLIGIGAMQPLNVDIDQWHDVTNLRGNFVHYDYRVKPEPKKPREWWIRPESLEKEMLAFYETAASPYRHNFIHVREVIDEP